MQGSFFKKGRSNSHETPATQGWEKTQTPDANPLSHRPKVLTAASLSGSSLVREELTQACL